MRRVLFYALLILLCYWPARNAPFYFDDIHTISQNAALIDPSQFLKHWIDPSLSSSLPYNRAYRPVTFSLYHLLQAWSEGATFAFHVFKMFLLFVLCLLTDQIWRNLAQRFKLPKPEWFSFFLGSCWAVHPALSESTIYITATSSVLAAVFYFSGILVFLKRPHSWLIQALFFGLATLSKEEAITFPAITLILAWFLQEFKQRQKAVWFHFIFAAALFAWIQSMIPSDQAVSRGSVTPLHYLLTQIRAWWWYQKLWWWPQDLNADNVQFGFTTSWTDLKLITSGLVQATLIGTGIVLRKRVPELLLGLVFYYISISPASSVIPLAEPVNERRMIIAYLGWTGGSLALLWRLLALARSRALLVAPFLFLIPLGLFTHQRANVWATPELLWKDTLLKNPDSPRAYNNLATVWIESGQFDQALKLTTDCSLRFPYVYCWLNRAISHQHLGEYSAALAAYERSLTLDPGLPVAHYYYGVFLYEIGLKELGIQELKLAQSISRDTHLPSKEKLKLWSQP